MLEVGRGLPARARRVFRLWGWRPLRLLGVREYAVFTTALLASYTPDRAAWLERLDAAMSRRLTIRFGRRRVIVDCPRIDQMCRAMGDESRTFASIRELYFADVYVGPHRVPLDSMDTVVDLGGNRGLFSLAAAGSCRKCIYVEAIPACAAIAQFSFASNGLHNVDVVIGMVGSGGALQGGHAATRDLLDILDEHGVRSVDFMKIDIEGSEFSLIEHSDVWPRVKYVSMEVHPEHGDIASAAERLESRGFAVQLYDAQPEPTTRPDRAVYLYGRNRALTASR